LNANDVVFVTQRTTTVDDEMFKVIYYHGRRLRRSSSSSSSRRAKKGKRLEFYSPCVTLLLSLFSLFRWQNLILSSPPLPPP
jgi:hypothetical protein